MVIQWFVAPFYTFFNLVNVSKFTAKLEWSHAEIAYIFSLPTHVIVVLKEGSIPYKNFKRYDYVTVLHVNNRLKHVFQYYPYF